MSATPTLVAGVDSSTQSTKVEIRRLDDGAVVAQGSAPHPTTTPPRSEQDPAAWLEAFHAAWSAAGAPDVAAISVAGQQHGMVALDGDGRVLRPAKLWNDTESAPDAGWLRKQLPEGAAAWAEAVGSVPTASFTATKLSWLHRSEPEVWARLAHVMLPHDWLTGQLARSFTTDRGDASGTGYWSPATGEYRWDLLAIIDRERDWSDVVPRVADPLEVVGTWHGAKVACGTGDNMGAALGLGLTAGRAVVSLGTSGTAFTVADAPTADATGAVAGFADATGRFLPLVCTLNATKVLNAFARLLAADRAGFDSLALGAAPGAGGLVLLPYLDGERTPNLPSATGVLAGVRSDVSREQLARAAVEAMAYQTRDVVSAMVAASGTAIRDLRVDGGASVMDLLLQLQADQLGVTVRRPRDQETTALGAAFLAGLAEGVWPSLEAISARWELDATFEPTGGDLQVIADLLHAQWTEAVTRSRDWAPHT